MSTFHASSTSPLLHATRPHMGRWVVGRLRMRGRPFLEEIADWGVRRYFVRYPMYPRACPFAELLLKLAQGHFGRGVSARSKSILGLRGGAHERCRANCVSRKELPAERDPRGSRVVSMCRRASRWLLGTLSVLQLHFSQASLGTSAVDALQRTRKSI